MSSTIDCVVEDITTLKVDAIVNAANRALLGGGGVDGAIHRAAGPGLLAECRALPEIAPRVRCREGEAVITGAHNLACKHVIHTVGPVWEGGGQGEDELLASCYRSCLALAHARGLASIAFPAISTGAFGFPMERAAGIAVKSVREAIEQREAPTRVVLCSFDARTDATYRSLLAKGT